MLCMTFDRNLSGQLTKEMRMSTSSSVYPNGRRRVPNNAFENRAQAVIASGFAVTSYFKSL
jgi:hypothetical protein